MGLFNRHKKITLSPKELSAKRDVFYACAQRFFACGLLREVYATDTFSICNLANSMYLAFVFPLVDDVPVGAVIDLDMFKKILKNSDYLYRVFQSYCQHDHRKYLVPMNDKLMEVFMPIKQKREKPGCEAPEIDLQFEAELQRKR